MMLSHWRIIGLVVLTTTLAAAGCDKPSKGGVDGDSHSSHDGHDHDHGDGDDHDHDHDHDGEFDLGSIDVAGTTLAVTISAEVEPNTALHVDVMRTSGPTPSAIRVWIGDESGAGSLKTRLDGDGDTYHGDTEAPSSLDGSALWLEVESNEGERIKKSLGLRPSEG